mgnify:CR=1 FL=1
MGRTSDLKIRIRLQEDYEFLSNLGYNVLGVFLYGSQNYEMDTENSDIDTKAIIIPNFEDLISRKEVSKTYNKADGSFLDVKDIYSMFNMIKKQGINFVEILYTDYKLINPNFSMEWKQMIESNRDYIARFNPFATMKAIQGTLKRMNNIFDNPNSEHGKEDCEKYGYCRKDFYNVKRLSEFARRYYDLFERYVYELKFNYKDLLVPLDREQMFEYKTIAYDYTSVCLSVKHELEETKTLVDRASNWDVEFKNTIKNNQEKVDNYMGSFMKIVIGRSLLDEFYKKGFGTNNG